MKELIENLYKMNRCLLGEGYDSALEYIGMLMKLKIYNYPSGMKIETWEVPDEWIVRDAWVKYKGKKIFDYKKQPLTLLVGSLPFKGKVKLDELKKHLFTTDIEDFDLDDGEQSQTMKGIMANKYGATPYEFKYYDKDWGFCISRKALDKFDGKEYEVFVDTEYRKGVMKVAEHTIPGKTDREILLLAHLDHPWQANDNLSGVACLVDLAPRLKGMFKHTIKIIFCPETIGSHAYAIKQDMSKVDFVISLDAIGNDSSLMVQKSFDENDKLNWVMHLALQSLGYNYRKGQFRMLVGSDEYTFSDPKFKIPGLMLTRYPYEEYHTSLDTPKIVKYERIRETQEFIKKVIEISETNYIPDRKFTGPLMRSKFGAQTFDKDFNRGLDYLFYLMDGKTDLISLCVESGLGYDYVYELLEKLKNENLCFDTGQEPERKITQQEHLGV